MKRHWGARLAVIGAASSLVLVGLATPSVAHTSAYGDAAHIHETTPAPKDTRCARLLSGAESVSAPADNPSGVTSATSPDENDPQWGGNVVLYGRGGATSQPSSMGTYATAPAIGAGDAVDHHWVHDDLRVGGTADPLVFDFGTAVSTVDYYPYTDHPEDTSLTDPFSGRVYGSNNDFPTITADDVPLDLVVVWDNGWIPETGDPYPTYIDDYVQRYVVTPASGPVRYVKVITEPSANWHDTEVDAVCTPTPPAEEPPPPPPGGGGGGEGCTPGFWKQSQHSNAWIGTGYTQNQLFEAVFGTPTAFSNGGPTLLDALGLGGGGMNALARHAVAALLNAGASDVDYLYTTAQVITMVQNAVTNGDFETAKNLLAAENERGCPINGKSPQSVPVP